MPEDPTPPRKRRLTFAQREQLLVDVATAMIEEGDLAAVNMDAVAARSAVNKGLVYQHFRNKEALLVAVFDAQLGDLEHRVVVAMAAHQTFEEQIRAMVKVWFEMYSEQPVVLALLRSPAGKSELQEYRTNVYMRIEDVWAALVAAEFDLPPDRALASTAVLFAGLEGLLHAWLVRGLEPELLTETFAELCFFGGRGVAERHPRNPS